MPQDYGSPFVRITAFGTIYVAERFNWTLSVIPSGDTVLQPSQADADAVLAAVRTFHTAAGHISGYAALQGVKLARIGADGLYGETIPAEAYHNPVTGAPGAVMISSPPQVALAVTLLGAAPRGPAGRGRFYVPMPAIGLGGDGRITQGQALGYANAAATMINSINSIMPGRVGIVGHETKSGRGPARQDVVAVRVGRVYDVIRSRRTSLNEEPVLATTAVTNAA